MKSKAILIYVLLIGLFVTIGYYISTLKTETSETNIAVQENVTVISGNTTTLLISTRPNQSEIEDIILSQCKEIWPQTTSAKKAGNIVCYKDSIIIGTI